MSKLIYITNTSLDGYIEDRHGAFDWADPGDVHQPALELLRPVGTYLYGRRLYETMSYWDAALDTYPPEYRDFARVWQKAAKIVFSRTLAVAATRNTRIERNFDAGAIQKLKQDSNDDITIGGAELAAAAFEAGLVDECHLFVHPLIFGGGKPAFRRGLRCDLELLESRRVGRGAFYVRYTVKDP